MSQPTNLDSQNALPLEAECRNSCAFREVYLDELKVVAGRRGEVHGATSAGDDLEQIQNEALSKDLCGLAISGGGIRSATFGLGIIQGLAKAKLLSRFDYLSTVSGGGYIGSFLSKWIHEEGMDRVEEELTGGSSGNPDYRIHARNSSNVTQIKHLRQYSNYLAPTPGIMSFDGWLLFAIYLRNLFLNQTVMLIFALGIFIFIRAFAELFSTARATATPFIPFLIINVIVVGLVIFLNFRFFSACEVRENQPSGNSSSGQANRCWRYSAAAVLALAIGLSLSVRLGNASMPRKLDWRFAVSLIAVSGLGFGFLGVFCKPKSNLTFWARGFDVAARWIGGAVAGTIGGCFLVAGLWWTTMTVATNICFSVPVIFLSFVLSEMIYVGLVRKSLVELEREWWSSINSRLMMLACIWAAFVSVAIYGPWVFAKLWSHDWNAAAGVIIGTGWVGTILSGILSARSSKTGDNSSGIREVLARIAPIAFLVLVLFGISIVATWAAYEAYGNIAQNISPEDQRGFLATIAEEPKLLLTDLNKPTYAIQFPDWVPIPKLPVAVVMFSVVLLLYVLAQFLSGRIGVNTFSLHNMYANRLVRCYLGATQEKRFANALTNFDADDDMPLADLLPTQSGSASQSGPIHIINGALNRNKSPSNLGAEPKDYAAALSIRDRKSESFVFTPMHAGSESTGYCPIGEFGGKHGVTLGNALAVSGAAVAPNMGYHSSPGITALLTVFNLRLGAWFGNPGNADTRQIEDPSVGLNLLVTELAGNTDVDSDYVYVSDGGHFENMGIYELIRRRCRFIVAVDADAAPNIRENVGRIVRLARIDFGIRIEIDATPIIPDKDGNSTAHLIVGRIHYGDVHRDANGKSQEQPPHDPSYDYDNNQGIIVWISLAKTGDESADIKNYVGMNPDFPFRSTADQFFDENEFESYRELGEHSVESMLRYFSLNPQAESESEKELTHVPTDAMLQTKKNSFMYTLENETDTNTYKSKHEAMVKLLNATKTRDIFASIFDQWLAQPDQFVDKYVRQNEQYVGILEILKNDDRLSRLANEVFGTGNGAPKADHLFIEKLMFGEVMTLLENVWLALDLEHNFLHPVHKGWLGVFKTWIRCDSFSRYWYNTNSEMKGLENQFTPGFVRFVESIRRIE